MLWNIRQNDEDVVFEIKVQPGAKKTEIAGVWDSLLKLKIAAKPEAGAANQECIRFLAKRLDVPRKRLCIIRGEFARRKVIRVSSALKEMVIKKLS